MASPHSTNCGYPWAHPAQQDIPEGHLPRINPTKLCDAYILAAGGSVPDDHVIYTIAAHTAGHTPTIEPHLLDLLARERARGLPLYLFDPAHPPPRLTYQKQREAAGAQILRLQGQGTFEPLTAEQLHDHQWCAIVGWLGTVLTRSAAASHARHAQLPRWLSRLVERMHRFRSLPPQCPLLRSSQ